MLFPLDAFRNPLTQSLLFEIAQSHIRIDRRHQIFFVIRLDPPNDLAILRFPRNRREVAIAQICQDAFKNIEPQIRLAIRFVGTVTLKALIRENRPNIAIEINRFGSRRKAEAARNHHPPH